MILLRSRVLQVLIETQQEPNLNQNVQIDLEGIIAQITLLILSHVVVAIIVLLIVLLKPFVLQVVIAMKSQTITQNDLRHFIVLKELTSILNVLNIIIAQQVVQLQLHVQQVL